jgi:hypothetical protein
MARGTFFTTSNLGPKQSLTPEGFLLCEEVSLARTGMMIYGPDETPIEAGPDGVAKIFREAEDVFHPDTIASAQGKPVTNDHPDNDVTPESWKELAHGFAMNVRRGEGAMDDLLLADLLITTPEGIKEVQSGKREISLGYEADYEDLAPGAGKQSNIIINHIALVEQGRCGPRCAISDSKPTSTKGSTMKGKNKILDAMMRAFKAKDAEEVEKIAEEVKDEGKGMGIGEGSDTHIHIHAAGKDDEEPSNITQDDEGGDFAAFKEQNDAEHAEFREAIAALQKQVAELGGGTRDADEAEEEKMKKEAADEVPEEFKEEAAKAKDSAYLGDSFRDTVAMAEILVPGIKVPTFDRSAKPGASFKKICGLRRQALDLAYVQPETRGVLDDLLGGKKMDASNMTCDAVRVLFLSASAMKRSMNNGARGNATADTGAKQAGPMTLAGLNAKNRERYADK